MVADFQKRFWTCIVLTLPVLALSPMIQHALGLGEQWHFSGDVYILTVLSSAIYFYGGWPFLDGLRQEVASRNLGMMTLIGVAITAAYIYSVATVLGLPGNDFFWELVTLIDIMLFGHWIEMKSVMGAGKALQSLAALIPDTAHLLDSGGGVRDIAVNTLKGGEHLLVKPGEKVPADSVIIKGEMFANELMLTGESKPVAKREGDFVIGGAINGEGAITVEVKHTGADSFLSGVIRLVQEAQASKSRTQDIANRAAFWLTVIALSVSGLTLFSWLFFTNQTLAFAIERAVTVLVISCPHALGLAVPLVVAVSTSIAATNGLLIRDRTAFEEARRTQAIVFDKTGTLTKGEFGITDVLVFGKDITEDDLVAYAASIEQHSEHPIAKGMVKDAKAKWDVENFRAIQARVPKGSSKARTSKPSAPATSARTDRSRDPRIVALGKQGKTVIFVLVNDELKGAIALADVIRAESEVAISRLKGMGIRCNHANRRQEGSRRMGREGDGSMKSSPKRCWIRRSQKFAKRRIAV